MTGTTDTDAAQWIVGQALAKLHDPAAYSIRDAIEEAAHVALEAMGAAAALGVKAHAQAGVMRGAILSLHKPYPLADPGDAKVCQACIGYDENDMVATDVSWPCATARLVLDAESAAAR